MRNARDAATWARGHLEGTDTGLLLLAVVIGAGAGGGAIVFRFLIEQFTKLLSGHDDFSGAGHASNHYVPFLGIYFVVLAPVVAGLLYGPIVYLFAREARGHGVPEVMYAVARNGGRIKPQVAAVKALASALCIGGGGSVGREGPIVQIGSALGSTLGTQLKLTEEHVKLLVACGAAGGIAATFNAPLAGVFFAMEIILRNFAARSFGMVVISSVLASVIGRAAFGNNPFLHLPGFSVHHPQQWLWFALLGVIAGAVGVLFSKVLYLIEDACDWAWRWPRAEWARPAVGGVLLGLLLLAVPQMYGVGYPVLGKGVAGGYALAALIGLLFAKMLATSLSIGIGGSGGVFAPSLFIGAMLGASFGIIVHDIAPGSSGPVGAYGLIGMGAVFAGSARAPITAVIILFELTNEYTIILPLMAAIVLATGVSQLLSKETIYTAKLVRRGVDIDAPVDPLKGLSVRVAMLDRDEAHAVPPADAPTVRGDMPLTEALTVMEQAHSPVSVIDADGNEIGVLSHRAVLAAVRGPVGLPPSGDANSDEAVVVPPEAEEVSPSGVAGTAADPEETPAGPAPAQAPPTHVG